MSTLNGQEIEIFRAGPHGIEGKRVYSVDEVDQIARDYDAKSGHEAPIVIGHPKLNSPAWGWVQKLRAENGVLYATPHQVVPEFEAAVKNSQYKKRSAAFDPLPGGKWQLRHVGFLGGTPPVVKGLADATFATEQYEEFEYEYSTKGDEMAAEQMDKSTFMGWLREAFADFGIKKGDGKTDELAALEQRLSSKFADDLKAEREARETKEQEFAAYKSKHETSQKSASATTAIDKLKADGKWLPAFDRMHVPAIFAAIAEGNTQKIEFADSKGDKHKLPTLDALSKLVGGISRFVPTGVTFGDEQAAAIAKPADNPPLANGSIVDDGSKQFDAEIRAKMAEFKLDYTSALRLLNSQGKSSASYATAAGSV